jgi:hypothetical protein
MSKSWEVDEGLLAAYSRMPARKKLEWLGRVHELMIRFYSRSKKKTFWKLRGIIK